MGKTKKYTLFKAIFHYSLRNFAIYIFNWGLLHARLNSHYEVWSYKERSTKKITGYRKFV